MSHSYAAINAKPFDVKEHRVVRSVRRVTPEYSPRRYDFQGHAATLHGVNLHGRSLRTERQPVRRVESVLRVAHWMRFRDVQRVEVVKLSLYLTIIFNCVTERHEHILNLLAQDCYRVKMAATRTMTGKSYINALALCLR